MTQKLRALPVQAIPDSSGILLTRGCTETIIAGDLAEPILQVVLSLLNLSPLTRDEILEHFDLELRTEASTLIDNLCYRCFVSPADDENGDHRETSLDVFYWQLGGKALSVRKRIEEARIA